MLSGSTIPLGSVAPIAMQGDWDPRLSNVLAPLFPVIISDRYNNVCTDTVGYIDLSLRGEDTAPAPADFVAKNSALSTHVVPVHNGVAEVVSLRLRSKPLLKSGRYRLVTAQSNTTLLGSNVHTLWGP